MKNTRYTDAMINGMLGLVVGDALGCPVQFMKREELRRRPVTDMEEFGTYDMPKGTWTDDSSLALAALASIREKNAIDPTDIMERFVDWMFNGAYTPYGEAFDQGLTCIEAIFNFGRGKDAASCGRTGEHANGNGALMRILPVCIFCVEEVLEGRCSDTEAIRRIHAVAALTHNHLRSNIACGLYYFMVKAIIAGKMLQEGLADGFAFYEAVPENREQLDYYGRTRDLEAFSGVEEREIRSSGYVVDSFEAAVWCLVTTESLEECLLKAVNLGDDTDTVAAIAGGLAGLMYGYEAFPAEWLDVIVKRDWIEELCR